MPTYDYRCPKCGHAYEAFQKISDRTRAKCPQCGTRGERRITGGAGIHFKGSGFYITDYKRSGDKKPAAASSDDKKSSGSDGSSTDKKPKKTGAES
ncbi:MAG: zinc ribbon domain-containing protein [Gemmatimonadota bacterium]|nr:MAG: zinc ribbon domain-containing protein [Gemmatimonadota bacterium]